MKFSTILLAPLFVLLALLFHWRTIWRTLLVMIVGFAVVVWPIYYLHVWNYPPERQHRDTADILRSFGNRILADPVVWASDKPVIRGAAQYGLGLLMVVQRSAGGNTVYFRGEVTNAAGPSYFPIVYFIKEPIAWWILAALALLFFLSRLFAIHRPFLFRSWIHEHFTEVAMLLWLAIYWFTSIRSTLNIGVRHLMPIIPFTIILASGQIKYLGDYIKNRLRHGHSWAYLYRGALAIIVLWFIAENLRVFPYYLTYFNQTAGGPSGGYQVVVDSNLDWGQDLKRFAQWVEKNNIQKIEFDYFGWADQRYYLGDRFIWLTSDKYKGVQDFLARNTSDGWLAVSATFLQNQAKDTYTWLATREPTLVIGNSIFVYRIE